MHPGIYSIKVSRTPRSSGWGGGPKLSMWPPLSEGQNLGSRLASPSQAQGPDPSGQCCLIMESTGDTRSSSHMQMTETQCRQSPWACQVPCSTCWDGDTESQTYLLGLSPSKQSIPSFFLLFILSVNILYSYYVPDLMLGVVNTEL